MSTVLAISDLHAPFEHRDALDFLRELKRKYKPSQVICLGDESDQHAMSMHDHDPNGHSAGDEYGLMLEHLQPFYDLFPVCRSMHSNHTSMPFRRASKFGIPNAYLKSYAEFMKAPKGWSWHNSAEVDGVWGMNCGWLGDREKYAFAYARDFKTKPILASGIIIDGRPQLITMPLTKSGRWTGDL